MKLLPAFFAALIFAASPAAGATRPNVIFILTDDQGWNDAHFAGHPYVKTPNLDRFASQGTWFRQFYVAATVCSPSRTAFMTSHYPGAAFGARALLRPRAERGALDAGLARSEGDDAARSAEGARATRRRTSANGTSAMATGAPPPSEYGFDVSKTVNSNGPQLGDEAKEPYFRAKSTALIVDETIKFIRSTRTGPSTRMSGRCCRTRR